MKNFTRLFSVSFLLLAGVANAAVFSLFSPATGILKGSASTYVTTAATSADIIGLWSGTCTGTNYLGADGACHSAALGSVTSVALSAPAIFSVTGSPVTSSGTLAFAYSGAQGDILYASGSTTLAALAKNTSATRYLSNTGTTNNPAWAQIDLTTGVTGILPAAGGGTANGFTAFTGPTTSTKTFTLPNATATILTTNAAVTVAQGGTGVATLTGIVKASGTSNFSAAVASDIVGLFTTCSGSQYLGADGACHNAGGAGTVQSVALTAPAIFSVTGSPVTTTGTLALAATGTSGGIPYFDSSTTLASSAALTANRIVLGGGAAVAPTVLGSLGTTTTLLHGNAAGAPTFGAVSLSADVTGTLADGSLSANVPLLNAANTFSVAGQTITTGSAGSNGLNVRFNGANTPMGFGVAASNGFPYLGFNTKQTISTDNQTYDISATAGRIRMDSGAVTIATAPSGTAGGTITWTDRFSVTNTGVMTGNGSVMPRSAWGKVNGSGTCMISNSAGLTTPCTRNSAGNYSITHNPTLSTNTSCTVTADTGSSTITQVLSASNGTTINVLTNVGAVATDALFSLICMSN